MKGYQEADQALKVGNAAKIGVRGKGCGSYRGGRGICRQSINKDDAECYKCHKLGHYQNEYPCGRKKMQIMLL